MVSSHPDFIILDKQITTISTQRWRIHRTKPQIPGISEEERQRRRESNKLSTRINFVGWILEVELPNWDSPRAKLNIQYLFIVTTCNFPVKFVVEWILEVEFFFAQFETMVIHIYQWNVWPRITITYMSWHSWDSRSLSNQVANRNHFHLTTTTPSPPHNGRKSLILAPQEIPDISGYHWGFGCQFVKAYTYHWKSSDKSKDTLSSFCE